METLEILRGNTITLKNTEESEEKEEMETKTRIVPSLKWCFTAYDEGDRLWIEIPNMVDKYALGREICPSTGRKHIQGYIECKKKIRPTEYFKTVTTHWEKTRGSREQNAEYCCKEGDFITNIKIKIPVIDPMKGKIMYDWQTEIVNIVKGPVDDRKIYWYWEKEGCTGKSSLAKHICMNWSALSVGGKGADIKYAVATYLDGEEDLNVLIYDVPRTVGNMVSYSSIEEIKNGCMFSGKYESGMKIFNPPHIIIFSNSAPLVENLSIDRWVIKNIGDNAD